jgi:hypothetical protein
MKSNLYVIEAWDERGSLLLRDHPQPESFFGEGAIIGITEDRMAQLLFAEYGDKISLRGDNIPNWPKLVNPTWTARRKTW